MPIHVEIRHDTPILQAPRCPVGKSWPIPVHQRLEQLVELALEDGERTSGTELLAAIVCAFAASPENISSALKSYRRSVAGNHIIDAAPGEVLRFEKRSQGRPAAR